MIKLELPNDTFSDSLGLCIEDIPQSKLEYKSKLQRSRGLLKRQSAVYSQRANSMDLHLFTPSMRAKKMNLVPECGDELTKNDLVSLYKDVFSKKGSKARSIYNRIKISSKEYCSICLVGTVSTLDHYLPKARYPAFSIEPNNLIPACSDCNKGKGASIISSRGEHVLHPYFSHNKFYEEKWLSAEVVEEIPVRLRYFVRPPVTWSANDIALIEEHFTSFKLAAKFSTYVSAHLITAIDNVDMAINEYNRTPDSIKKDFLKSAESRPNKNSPVVAMFEALSRSDWFCSDVRRHQTGSMI